MMTRFHPPRIDLRTALFAGMFLTMLAQFATAQIPGLPTPAGGAAGNAGSATKAQSEKEKGKPNVAATTGPITVKQQVSDKTLERFLDRFLPKYPGIRRVSVTVDDGVVTLNGRVQDDDTSDEVTDVVKRVEGVRLVMNQMNTDDEVMSAWEFAARELGWIGTYFRRNWLLMVVAAGFLAVSVLVARLFAAKSEVILAPLVRNVLLRSVAGSVISSLVVLGGPVAGAGRPAADPHRALDRRPGVDRRAGGRFRVQRHHRELHRVRSAGRAPAVSNRRLHHRCRPDRRGQVAEYAGDRAGDARREPCTHPQRDRVQGDHDQFDGIAELSQQLRRHDPERGFRHRCAGSDHSRLAELPGILRDPPPRALIESLEPDGVKIRAYLWAPTQNADWFKLLSEAKLKTKVALQQAAGIGTGTNVPATQADGPSVSTRCAGGPQSARASPAAANLRRDARAVDDNASGAGRAGANGKRAETPVTRVLNEPETRVSEEGANLLKGSRDE